MNYKNIVIFTNRDQQLRPFRLFTGSLLNFERGK